MSFIDALFHYKKGYLTFLLNFSFTYQHTVMHEYIITILFIMHNKVQTFQFNNFRFFIRKVNYSTIHIR